MAQNSPLVSVIMNCYNGERFLKEAIDSVYAQTFTDWEIIFWDNASTDASGRIARSYDHKMKYFRARETTPLGKARNLAIQKASGQYLAFLDCDDLWLPDKLTAQIDIFEKAGRRFGFVYGRCEKIYSGSQKTRVFRKGERLPDGNIFSELLKENFIPFLSGIIDKEKFFKCGGFPDHFKNSTDYFIFLNLARKHDVGVLQDVCCKSRIHDNNLSRSQRVVAAKENMEIVSSFLPGANAEIGIRHQYVYLAASYLLEKKAIKAFSIMVRKGGWRILLAKIWRRLKFRMLC